MIENPPGCMKQIHTALSRTFGDNPRVTKEKWKGIIVPFNGDRILNLYHYHHLVLQYNTSNGEILYEWYEKPADKRGLDSAKIWLNAYRNI